MKIAYDVWGAGRRTLFLHGFTGNRRAWDVLRPYCEQSLQALVVDLPGHGETELPKRSGVDGFRETLRSLRELLEEWGPSDVVGYSQGARLALALALRGPRSAASRSTRVM